MTSFVYDAAAYEKQFKASINKLEKAESTTREILRDLSREVLFILHEHGNICYVNKLIGANMTSINKKAMVLFLKEFTGFVFNKDKNEFEKKNKQTYDEKKQQCLSKLTEDPHFNFWSWAQADLEIERKEFDPSKITKYMQTQLKRAEQDGVSQRDVLNAVFAAGIDLTLVLEIINGFEDA